jgi:tetratricopeptide (TPR) repeat protein
MAKRWKKEEFTYLKRYAKERHVAALAERFKTDAATVLLKLKELDLEALDSVEPAPLEGSHQLAVFERALRALHASKWEQAAQGFEKVIAEGDQHDLINRAKRYLAIARGRLEGPLEVEADDPYLQAVYERNRGNFDAALSIASAGGRRAKDPRFAYLVASIHVARGELDEAAQYLETAIELDPMSRVHAVNDAEFAVLRAESDYADLFAE